MAETRKILGQAALAATTLTDVYTVPGATEAVCQIDVCNRGAATTFRLALAIAGAADATKQYIAYDAPLAANDSVPFYGICLGAADVVRAYAASANVSVTVNGVELT